ncbi:IMPACT family protein [Rhodanobacter sp. AS-Z3]|uniref:IMPACT family protein n=1 Tax=Rhodanobacter sp. AS-Z3 TaxID=3031330 RepID=UPI00247B24D2|nr:YigZ family protein [Rhodanobacter sp. AS-Z3]WEN13940.1 IMPACT family protein [Rhodanobacter sp. AS-Z3]
MSETLSTLVQRCVHQEEIKKSRFLAHAAPVDSAEQALAFLREVADPAATHNCWAYRIGQDYRFNDDGEPGGTAGRPILQAIEGQGMDRVMAVVTRWYGGIKLGAGGLVRAYGGTAAECLRRAEHRAIIPMATLTLSCPFADLALFKARLQEFDGIITQEDFTADGADLQLTLPVTRVQEAIARITDLTRGHGLPVRID